jgi:hypothetical protein
MNRKPLAILLFVALLLCVVVTQVARAGCSSGLTAITTSDDNWTTVSLSFDSGDTHIRQMRELTVMNTGGNAGFVRFAGGVPHYIPANAARIFKFKDASGGTGATVEIKNATAGSNLSGVYISGL